MKQLYIALKWDFLPQKMAVSVDFSLFNIEITVGALLVIFYILKFWSPLKLRRRCRIGTRN
jgi:hypothetical protein